MWKENLYQPIEILLREHDEFPIGEHQHSFFEMAYIFSGSGRFKVQALGNEEQYDYAAGDLYLVPPNHPHLYTISSHSRYIFIRFTENYVHDYINRYIGNILEVPSQFRIRLREADLPTLHNLMNLVAAETANPSRYSELLLQYYVNSIILLTARSLSELTPECNHTDSDKAQYMLQYIQQHIHQPELLKLNALAEKFRLSPSYVGRFFKRNFGEDFRQYVSLNRLRKVEEMLVNTRMSIKEIANRMGYIDSCYLNKLFQQHHGITPLQYRKMYADVKGVKAMNKP